MADMYRIVGGELVPDPDAEERLDEWSRRKRAEGIHVVDGVELGKIGGKPRRRSPSGPKLVGAIRRLFHR